MSDGSPILIIDDDADLRETISEVLEEEGLATVAVPNGGEALRYLASSPCPRLILLDLMMPVMDGWRFREEQLKDPRLASIPVIVMSAGRHVEVSQALEGLEIVWKPVTLEALLEVVHKHLRGDLRAD